VTEPEYWVDVPKEVLPDGSFEYEASSHGRIRRKETGLILSTYPTPKGANSRYVSVQRAHGKSSNRTVARLVYVAFNPEGPWPEGNKVVVRQINDEPNDFRPQNLVLGKNIGRPPGPRRNGYLRDPR